MDVTLKAAFFEYDQNSGTYLIKLSDTTLVSHDMNDKLISFKIAANKVHQKLSTPQHIKDTTGITQILDDDQMDFLLDEIEMDNDHQMDQQIRRESYSNHASILSDMISEWNLNINKSPSTSSQSARSIHDCQGSQTKPRDCKHCQRVAFIMRYYSSWVRLKHSSQHQPDMIPTPTFSAISPPKAYMTQSKNKIKQIMDTFEWISDFFYELTNYSTYDLCNDFQHILQFHIRCGSVNKLQTIGFFEKALGKCCDMNCRCYSRHKRDKNVDNMMEDKRKEAFFIYIEDLSKQKASEFKINNEINLQNMLDKIHVSLLHHKHKLFTSNSSKYISKIQRTNTINNNQMSPHQQEEKRQIEGDDDGDDPDVSLRKYTFGSSITYWDPNHHRYCKPKYSDLRCELLNNTVYALSPEMYENLKSKALHFLNTKAGQSLVAQREHDWMKKFRILRGSQITSDHVIALYCYVNIPCLQRAYKRFGYQREGKTRDELLNNHSEIWHYSRLLLESVHCYGTPLDKTKNYYHGIDCKLIFDRYNVMIDVPVSLTTDKDIAYSFSDVSGITVEFGHGGLSDLQSLCLDLSLFSDFPHEEEYLIFHTFVSVRDICIKRLHHDQWLNILRFWHKLTEGFFFKHLIENKVVTRNDQLCICAMIQNLILTKTHKKYDHRIPMYMQKLFNTLGGNAAFWIVESEYDVLVPKLKKMITSTDSPFLDYISINKKIPIRYAQTFNWKINPFDTNRLFKRERPWIKSEKYRIYLNERKDHLEFHFECQNKPKSNLFRCRIHLDSKPKYVSRISFGNGLFCKELQFDNYSYGELSDRRSFNLSLHSLFETNLLESYTMNGFNLKLQIQIFSIKNKNGDKIAMNPYQE